MLKYFLYNNVISPKQSGFHDIFTSFDKGLEVRRVFVNITKAFDKVWHDGLIYN